MLESLQRAAKAWVAVVGAGVVPIVADATESFLLTVVSVIVAGIATYAIPNRP